jgi:hypothetical protein
MFITAARHFVEHMAGALAEQPSLRWRRNSGGADGVREGGGGAGDLRGGGVRGEGGEVGGRGSRAVVSVPPKHVAGAGQC